MKRRLLLPALLLVNSAAFAAIDVRIIDCPTSVLRYSPVIVTARVENQGNEAVLIPATNTTDSRYFLQIGRTQESLTELVPSVSTGGKGGVVWLKPGESWLFQVDVGPWLPEVGGHAIRAGIRGTGECRFRATGKETFPLKAIGKRPGYEAYECWSGEELSKIATIDIREPDSQVDREALDFIRSPGFPVDCCLEDRFQLRLQLGAAALLQRFPTSHYAYVAGYYAGNKSPDSLRHLIDLQPANSLNPYTRLSSVLAQIRSNSQAPSSEQIRALDLPTALKEYLAQETRGGFSPEKPTPTP